MLFPLLRFVPFIILQSGSCSFSCEYGSIKNRLISFYFSLALESIVSILVHNVGAREFIKSNVH